MLDEDGEPRFSASLMARGSGALWCADYEYPVLVRVADGREPEIWACFPDAGNDEDEPADGPRAVVAGLGSVWVLPGAGDRLLQIEPAAAGLVKPHPLPFPLASLAAGTDAVFGIGELGDGRVARFAPGEGLRSAPAGGLTTLQLIAASADYIWAVDDGTGTIVAADAHTLRPVRTFSHVGGPAALCAGGSSAWYVSTAETAWTGPDGRQHRTGRLGPDGFQVDVVRLDAATGAVRRLRQLAGAGLEAVLDGPGSGSPVPVQKKRTRTNQ